MVLAPGSSGGTNGALGRGHPGRPQLVAAISPQTGHWLVGVAISVVSP
jgi:hypothetical protein